MTSPASQRRHYDHLLVGGGMASAACAETLRLEGAQGSIAIVCAEEWAPYYRPALTKQVLIGQGATRPPPIAPAQTWIERRVDVLTATRIVSVDPSEHLVRTQQGEALSYGTLLIATGAQPRRLAVEGGDLAGIHVVRDLSDIMALRVDAAAGRRAVVVGASFIGLEVASALRQRGVLVTLVALKGRVFDLLDDAEISACFTRLFERHGVTLVEGGVRAFSGRGRVDGVLLDDRRLDCDFVVLGIGVSPDTSLVQGTDIEVADGIVVDRTMESSVKGVYAAGDVANFFDPVFNRRRRVEHWDNARQQGALAARNMLGHRVPFDEVSSFFAQAFDANFQLVGMVDDATERVHLGQPCTASWGLLYLKAGIPRALFSMARPEAETHALRTLIRYRTPLSKFQSALQEPAFSLANVPARTVLILQGGGALGAFEAGVMTALEAADAHPDVVAGVSIGAFNAAIIASHPRGAASALKAFWRELATWSPDIPDEASRRWMAAAMALAFGVPTFFKPRWSLPSWDSSAWPTSWTSIYDTSSMRALLSRYVDFPALGRSPVRVLMTAVDVETAELEVFDSYADEITVDHVMASGSLPPALPWATIDGRHYWDGGIVSNSPLDIVIERCGVAGTRIYIVDLFPARRPLPQNLVDVLTRHDEIVYAERMRRTTGEQRTIAGFRTLVRELLDHLPAGAAAQLRQRPRFVELMGAQEGLDVTRIVREPIPGETASCDFDFSVRTIAAHMAAGERRAGEVLRSRAAKGEPLEPP